MRVYFDASVIIAALLSPTGGSSLLLKYAKDRIIIGIASQTVIDEVVNKKEKLRKTKEAIENFIAGSGLVIRKHITETDIEPYEQFTDKEDAHLIAGANITQCAILVTLDRKHLLRQDIREKCVPLKIETPKDLLLRIIEKTE